MIAAIKVTIKTHKIIVNGGLWPKIIVSQKGTQGPPGTINSFDPGDLAALFSSI
jgi:hypothetical protein